MTRPRAAIALLAALALTACGATSPQELLARAPDALLEQGTVRYQQGVVVTGADGDVLLDTTTEGEQDLASGHQRMVVHVDDPSQQQPLDAVEVLLVDTDAYLRRPGISTLTGVEWARVDLGSAALLPGFDQALQDDSGPVALLRELRGAADGVEELGEEEVRGVTTRRLRVQVDVRRAIEQAPPQRQEALRRAAEELGVPDRYPMEVWLDADALPRRIVTVVEGDDPAFGATTREVRTDLYDFGEPVDVGRPAPEDVQDLSELVSQLGGGA